MGSGDAFAADYQHSHALAMRRGTRGYLPGNTDLPLNSGVLHVHDLRLLMAETVSPRSRVLSAPRVARAAFRGQLWIFRASRAAQFGA